MPLVYLGLGANLGSRQEAISEAYARLEAAGERIVRRSRLYETEPWGITDQPRFLNAACAIETARAPHALLATLKAIESAMGRQSTVRNGPRVIDIDILMYDAVEISTEVLRIPHPGMLERGSVLVPLNDIAPVLRHVLTGRTMRYHLALLGPTKDIAPYPPGLR
ncbi:MAG: 2-amino-4-hydroxy-6-hydroxymethyldihydropteridine diphosphokinase [Anaerolineae bacterium]